MTHLEDEPSENVHIKKTHDGRLEIPDLNISVNHDECERIIDNSTNYVETGRSI